MKTTIIVTGATGHIAKHIIKSALEKGCKAVGTVRASAKEEQVKKCSAALPSSRR